MWLEVREITGYVSGTGSHDLRRLAVLFILGEKYESYIVQCHAVCSTVAFYCSHEK